MEGKQHGDVVAAIKAGGDEAKLLVVDKETDEFFKKCKVIPSQEHLNGEWGVQLDAPGQGYGQSSRLCCVPGGWRQLPSLDSPSFSFMGGPAVRVGESGAQWISEMAVTTVSSREG
jgi:hypothetical protein